MVSKGKPQKKKNKELLELSSKTDNATITVSFNSGVGSLTAKINRADHTSDELDFDSSGGSKTFDNASADDTITVHVDAASDTDITISRKTNPPTPINLKASTDQDFTITE